VTRHRLVQWIAVALLASSVEHHIARRAAGFARSTLSPPVIPRQRLLSLLGAALQFLGIFISAGVLLYCTLREAIKRRRAARRARGESLMPAVPCFWVLLCWWCTSACCSVL
jgi:hypothetical protein